MRKQKEWEKQSGLGLESIGVIGLQPGCGATAMALMVAKYLKDSRKAQVLYVEANDSSQIDMLRQSYSTDSSANGKLEQFMYQKVWLTSNVNQDNRLALIGREGQVSVYDYGVPNVQTRGEFFRCQKRIVVSDGSVIRSRALLRWLQRFPQEEMQYDLVVHWPEKELEKQLDKNKKLMWHKQPFNPDPFSLCPEMLFLLQELFS